MTTPSYTVTNDSVMVVLDGTTHTIKRGDENFKPVRLAIIDEDWATLPTLLSRAKALEEWAKGAFEVKHGHVYYQGDRIPTKLNSRIVRMARAGDDPQMLFDFWERLQRNPSMRSVSLLYDFLEHQNIPIIKGGYFLAYKSVRRNYTDHHTGTVDHRPGCRPKVPRNKVSDDPCTACHFGLHVGSESFAKGFSSSSSHGSRQIVCQIDPEHVVCVPYDASSRKMRVCELLVLGNKGDKLPDTVFELDTQIPEDPSVPAEDGQDDPVADAEAEVEAVENGNHRRATMMAKKLSDLRDQAKKMGIKNVKAIAGGKSALVDRMLQVAAEDEAPKDLLQELEAVDVVEKDPKKAVVSARDDTSPWASFNAMSNAELSTQSLGLLRKYAGKELHIVGASKIPGGKPELLKVILKARD